MSVDTPDWVRDGVFYQIFPDRFASSARVPKPGPLEPWDAPPTPHGFKGGDLLGIVERLDDLQDLGITALYLNPVFASASNHRYHTDDYEHVDPLLGGDAALRELLDAAHGRGMHVVLDGVFNHSGRGWFPFHHVLENGAHSPYRDWFHIDQGRLDSSIDLNAFPTPDQEAEARRLAVAENIPGGEVSQRFYGYRGWWDLPALPKIKVEHPQTRAYLLAIAERWIAFGADGWRLDVPEEIDMTFWREVRERVRTANPDAYLVGEIWNVRHEWLVGDTFDALMDYPLTEALLGFCGGRSLDWESINGHDQYRANVRPIDGPAFAAELARLLGAYDPAVVDAQFNLLGSHDTPRFITASGGDVTAYRLATLIQMTLPGAPSVYYGDEVGMTGRNDPQNRGAFPVHPADRDEDLRAFVKRAIALRGAHAALRGGP
ncbi:MAG: glycoside hydrolase family 13 protein, partial [Candidatus Limnocylindria bacterium]